MKRLVLCIFTITILCSLVFPTASLANTRWDLEGWRVDQGKWMDGLLWTWYEDDWVPHRLNVIGYEGENDITIRHDYRDNDGHCGFDGTRNFFIGDQVDWETQPSTIMPIPGTAGTFHVEGPTIEDLPGGIVLEYHIKVDDTAALVALGDFAFYWEAHLSLTGASCEDIPAIEVGEGSSYWNGASLHSHVVQGNQDVPIKTPPQGEPPIPELSTIGLFLLGLVGMGGFVWFMRRRKAALVVE